MGTVWTKLWGTERESQRPSSTIQRSSATREQDHPLPSAIQHFSATTNGMDGTVTLEWSHPERNRSMVTGYEIFYRKEEDSDLNSLRVTVSGDTNMRTFTQNDGVEPLTSYLFKIRPTSHSVRNVDWKSIAVYISWYCQLPGCTVERRRREDDNSATDFCSQSCAREFSSKYCLLPGCCNEACDNNHFCSNEHRDEAIRKGCSGLVLLEESCTEYKEVQKSFSKRWSAKKGTEPQIYSILKVVNPSLEEKLKVYSEHLPPGCRKIKEKKYYHGTFLNCELSKYLQSCSNSSCAICNITKKGFDPDRISCSTWQRFGKGFYLARNSSKAYDYPLSHRVDDSAITHSYRAILVCDVAPGKKYILHKNEPNILGPPPGYHSVYGQAKWLFIRRSPDLNYDELVVFNSEALRPSYILLCQNFCDGLLK